jgi:hypothetical protein
MVQELNGIGKKAKRGVEFESEKLKEVFGSWFLVIGFTPEEKLKQDFVGTSFCMSEHFDLATDTEARL